jgi:dihydroxyacetone kinase-like predicted kinase
MPNSEQKIEAPMEDDVTRIARQLIHASSVAREAVGKPLDGTIADLAVLQEILDARTIERDAT